MKFATNWTANAETVWLEGRVRLIETPGVEDDRGRLLPFEFDQLPFQPRSAFVVQDVPAGTTRGRHARASQQLLLVCVAGAISVQVCLDGARETIALDHSRVGLLIEAGVWTSQTYVVAGSVLLVIASGNHDPSDYQAECSDPSE